MKQSIAIFTFHPETFTPWGPNSIRQGIGGSEEAVIYMASELTKLGNKVTVFNNRLEADEEKEDPRYLPPQMAGKERYDVAIVWRIPEIITHIRPLAKKVLFWPHDTCGHQISKAVFQEIDEVLWLSKWQRAQWISVNPYFEKFSRIFGNGLEASQFPEIRTKKNPYACIYGSNYARGLNYLLDIWPDIKQDFPKATLDVYYGWDHWGLLTKLQEQTLRDKLHQLKNAGVTEQGKVGHKELAQAYAKASLWTYPCTHAETFCITAIKAQAAGCIPVIVQGSALNEVSSSGYQCETHHQYPELLKKALQEAPDKTLQERKSLREKVLDQFTWKKIAERWQFLF